MTLTWVNGQRADSIDPSDRGLAFGDGLFETMRLENCSIPLLSRHLDRLMRGCARLSLSLDRDAIAADIDNFLASLAQGECGVIKLLVTRGYGGIGYRKPVNTAPNRILRLLPRREVSASFYTAGVALRTCSIRLSEQPLLAGIKHLNRLEQVLARAEWDDDSVYEGLMLDARGNVVECVAHNVFMISGGRLVTPLLDRCGVSGVMRSVVIEELAPALGLRVEEVHMPPRVLAGAQELFICNAVAGVLPVNRLDTRRWSPGAVTRAIQSAATECFVV